MFYGVFCVLHNVFEPLDIKARHEVKVLLWNTGT